VQRYSARVGGGEKRVHYDGWARASVAVTLRTLVACRRGIEAPGGVLGWLLTSLGAVGAIRLTFDLEDDGALHQAIEEGHRQGAIE